MRYSLVICNGNNFTEIKNYTDTLGFYDLDETKLSSIVKFTSSFNNENELKETLLLTDLLDRKDILGTLRIAYYRGKNSDGQLLPYGLSYKRDKHYYSTPFLESYFARMLTNYEFMDTFILKYAYHLGTRLYFSEELRYITNSYRNFKEYGFLYEQTDYYMKKFVKKYTTRKNNKTGRYVTDFTRLRELAMFAITFEEVYVRENSTQTEDIEDTILKIELELEHYNTLVMQEDISEEEKDHYQNKIDSLERDLEKLKEGFMTRKRKCDDYNENDFAEY